VAGWSVRHGRQSDDRIIGDGGDGLKGHVAGALDGPFVVLLEQDRADQPGNGGLVGEDADDLGAPLDLAVQPLERVRGLKLRAALRWKGRLGEHVRLRLVHEFGQFRHLRPELVGDATPHFWLAAPTSSRAKAVATKAEITRRPLLPAWASALRMK